MMNLGHIYSLQEFARLINYSRGRRGLSIITRRGTYNVQAPDAFDKLRLIVHECYDAAQRAPQQKNELSARATAKASYMPPVPPQQAQPLGDPLPVL